MKAGELTSKCYWKPQERVDALSKNKTYENVCSDVNALLTAAVERRLVADVPFGAFLSGGIDSSAIVALMSRVSAEKVRTFTVTFDEGEFSEAQYATMIAKKYQTDHHEIKLKPSVFMDELPM